MIYYTGDIHGSNDELVRFCINNELIEEDVVILLGDVGANYYGGKRDQRLKESFTILKPTFLCIHGNHEMRPATLDSYIKKEWNGGTVWFEPEYPNLLFAKDGEIYTIEGLRHIAIGGAYSVDKYYRLMRGFGWWKDEQPSEEMKAYVESQLAANPIDIILSHTCPFKYEPVEMFLPGIDQSTVDTSTEHWLDQIEETTDYLISQAADGYGEGIEQREIRIPDGEMYVSFWNSNDDYFMYNESEFDNYLQDLEMGGIQ